MSFTGIGDRVSTGFGNRVGRWQDSARQARAGINAAKPPVRVETGPTAPDWAYRIGCLVFGVLTIIAMSPSVVLIVVLSGLLLVTLIRPSAATAGVFCGVLGLFWMIYPSSPNSLPQFAILALAPALWMLSGTIAELPLRAKIELAVLRRPALRYLVSQLVGQPLLILTEPLKTHRAGIETSFAAAIVLVIVVIMAITAWLIFPRFARQQE